MSSITINIKPDGTAISLPIDYHHILQAVVYDLMRNGTANASLHDTGCLFGNRAYKLFTFGPPTGIFHRAGNKIVFDDMFSFEVRMWDKQLMDLIRGNIADRGIRFGSEIYRNVTCSTATNRIESDDIIISMQSPICLYTTDSLTHHTHYIRPRDPEFGPAVSHNFNRKYAAATGSEPDSEISLSVIDVRPGDKYVTRYKNFIIEGYKGTYRLKGKPEYLSFLYDTGLGAKNAQGFGMFRVIE